MPPLTRAGMLPITRQLRGAGTDLRRDSRSAFPPPEEGRHSLLCNIRNTADCHSLLHSWKIPPYSKKILSRRRPRLSCLTFSVRWQRPRTSCLSGPSPGLNAYGFPPRRVLPAPDTWNGIGARFFGCPGYRWFSTYVSPKIGAIYLNPDVYHRIRHLCAHLGETFAGGCCGSSSQGSAVRSRYSLIMAVYAPRSSFGTGRARTGDLPETSSGRTYQLRYCSILSAPGEW